MIRPMYTIALALTLGLSSLLAEPTLAQLEQNRKLTNFLKHTIFTNRKIQIMNVTPVEAKEVKDSGGWTALFTIVDLKIVGTNKRQPMTFFVKDGIFSEQIYNMKTGEDYAYTQKPTLPHEAYNPKMLLAGSSDAKHKFVLFSDPLCPFCQQLMPRLYVAAKRFPKEFALYYYPYLMTDIHPASPYVSSALDLLKKNPDTKSLYPKAYTLTFPKNASALTIAQTMNAKLKTALSDKEILDNQEHQNLIKTSRELAMRCGAKGTPTLFMDGTYVTNQKTIFHGVLTTYQIKDVIKESEDLMNEVR